MAIHSVQSAQFRRASPPTMQTTTIPAPTGGMDSRQNLAAESLELCIFSYNLNPSEYGMAVRQGYRRYQTDVVSVATEGVRTIVPYAGLAQDGTGDRLFAVTNEGIFDCTVDGAAPILKFTFTTQTGEAGYGVYTAYVTDAEENILFYADRVNGLFRYDPSTDLWAQASGLIGVDEELVNFIMVHKQRIWMGVQDESTAYYLDVAAVNGQVTPFYFGSKFAHGGEIVGLYNWTVDGGEGVDDHLVVVSRGGDVLPYKGSDPESSEWANIGTYFIGAIPRGNKIGVDYGGDLILLSEFGVTAMSDLLKSSSAVDPSDMSITFKVASLIRRDLRALDSELGWELRYLPTQALLLVQVPQRSNGEFIQYALLRTTNGWCYWRGMPMACVDTWRGSGVFGTKAGHVERMDSVRDAVVPADQDAGQEIPISILGNYTSLGSRGMYKRCEFVRPTFIGEAPVTYNAKAFYDYSIDETNAPPHPPPDTNSLWDSGEWGTAVWTSDRFQPTFDVRGTLNMGRTVAVALAGNAQTGTFLVSVDVMWRPAGPL